MDRDDRIAHLNARLSEVFELPDKREALELCREMAVLVGEDNPDLLKNLSTLRFSIFDVEGSLDATLRKIKSGQPALDDIDHVIYCLRCLGKHDEALSYISSNSHLSPMERNSRISWLLHRKRRHREAFIATELGRGGEIWTDVGVLPRCPRWDGSDLRGKSVCVVAESGLGDQIIFSRWISDLKRMGAEVHYLSKNSLDRVFSRQFGIGIYDPSITYDHWVPIMSLPFMLGTTMPGDQAYLSADETHVERWRERLGGDSFSVINWTGDLKHMENHLRTIPTEDLISAAGAHGPVYSVCLNGDSCPSGAIDLTGEIRSWDDTLAILSLSSLCLTCSSSVSVAAAAMGKRTFAYTHAMDYFVWCSAASGQRTHWFPDAWVWRQRRLGEWRHPIQSSIPAIHSHLD